MIYIGIDPGASSGSIAVISDDRDWTPVLFKLENATERMISDFLCDTLTDAGNDDTFAVIEKLSNMAPPQPGRPGPGRGSKANWSLSGSYHGLRMALACHCIPFVAEAAGKWQLAMGCRTGGDKKVSQRKAQEFYPELKVSQWKADALLLATYCRRHHKDLF